MKNFILKSALFAAVVTTIMTFTLNRYGGYLDDFYLKFATAKQHSLILGDSKSLTGIQPSIINSKLGKLFETPVFNFSFTMGQAAYGELYLESVARKLNRNTKNGLFILTVNPWMLSQREKDDFAKGVFFEQDMPPYNMHFMDIRPNPEYLLKNYKYFHFQSIFRKASTLHADGWFEEKHIPSDSATMKALLKHHEGLFAEKTKKWRKSQYRVGKLNETVAFLKKYGTVILVRMPSDKNIEAIELAYWKDFDSDMRKIAVRNAVRFLDYSGNAKNFPTFDGVHFDNRTGKSFTESLCDSIRKHRND